MGRTEKRGKKTKATLRVLRAHPMWSVHSSAAAAVVVILSVCIAVSVIIHDAVLASARQSSRGDFDKAFVVGVWLVAFRFFSLLLPLPRHPSRVVRCGLCLPPPLALPFPRAPSLPFSSSCWIASGP